MTLFPWTSASKLRKARQSRQAARDAYSSAKRRGDTRAEHTASLALSRATAEVLAIEARGGR